MEKRFFQNSAHMKKNWIIYPKSFINAWAELDAGTLDYDCYIDEIIDQVPEHLKDCIRRFAKEWPRCTTLLPDTITFYP